LLLQYRYICKSCASIIERNRRKKRKEKAIEELTKLYLLEIPDDKTISKQQQEYTKKINDSVLNKSRTPSIKDVIQIQLEILKEIKNINKNLTQR